MPSPPSSLGLLPMLPISLGPLAPTPVPASQQEGCRLGWTGDHRAPRYSRNSHTRDATKGGGRSMKGATSASPQCVLCGWLGAARVGLVVSVRNGPARPSDRPHLHTILWIDH